MVICPQSFFLSPGELLPSSCCDAASEPLAQSLLIDRLFAAGMHQLEPTSAWWGDEVLCGCSRSDLEPYVTGFFFVSYSLEGVLG